MEYRNKTHRMSILAMLLGGCLVLSYLEAVLPLTTWIALPGFKLGLSNILITLTFVVLSKWDAACLSFSRICIMGILFSNLSGFLFSLCGGVLSYIGLWLLAEAGKRWFSIIGVSIGCATFHNIGQLLMASIWFGSETIFGYLPFLLVASLIFGTITGILLYLLLPSFKRLSSYI